VLWREREPKAVAPFSPISFFNGLLIIIILLIFSPFLSGDRRGKTEERNCVRDGTSYMSRGSSIVQFLRTYGGNSFTGKEVAEGDIVRFFYFNK
jgi:hypothetical protein